MNATNIAHATLEARSALEEIGPIEDGSPLALVRNALLSALARLERECPDYVAIVEAEDRVLAMGATVDE